MLIRRTPDTYEKLQLLGGMASDDVLSQPQRQSKERRPYSDPKKNPLPGVYKASMPNGKTISLLRVMFTDFLQDGLPLLPQQPLGPEEEVRFQTGGTGAHLYGATPTAYGGRAVPELGGGGHRLEDDGEVDRRGADHP